MLAYIQGKVLFIKQKYAVVDHQGLGYKIFVGEMVARALRSGDEVKFFLYHKVAENTEELFGFENMEHLELFELLITVSGIGPKTALNMVDGAKSQDLLSAIAQKDIAVLSSYSGIGKKTAERIATELSDKVAYLPSVSEKGILFSGQHDLIETLVSLGFKMQEARSALEQVDRSSGNEHLILKEALKILGKK